MKLTDYTIVSAPHHVTFVCPYCGNRVRIKASEFENIWSVVTCECPDCGKEVDMGQWDYD